MEIKIYGRVPQLAEGADSNPVKVRVRISPRLPKNDTYINK